MKPCAFCLKPLVGLLLTKARKYHPHCAIKAAYLARKLKGAQS